MRETRPRSRRPRSPDLPRRARQAHLRERLQGSLGAVAQAPDHARQREPAEPGRREGAQVSRGADGKALIKRACLFAEKAHTGQLRKSGEPYYYHVFATGVNLATLRMDTDTIAAGIMHDVLEDTTVSHEEMTKEFGRRRQRVMELLSEIPGWKCSAPAGAFYVFPDVSAYFGKSVDGHTLENADDLCMYLLNTAHVSTVTGRAFGSPECIRLSFANSLPKIEVAYQRIKDALAQLK